MTTTLLSKESGRRGSKGQKGRSKKETVNRDVEEKKTPKGK
jgi:hypothetical protein